MIRKFNYTGRKRIERDRVQVSLIPQAGQAPSFDASIQLADLGLPGNGAVYIEVYDKSSYMRFDFGTVEHQTPPSRRQLVDLQSREIFSFRVKVVDQEGSHGKVLAVADRLPPVRLETGGTDKESLLAVSSEDLEDQIWKLDFSKDVPVLILNSRLEDLGIRELVRSDDSISMLILPAVFRQILVQIFLVDQDSDPEEGSWQNLWRKFLSALGAAPESVLELDSSENISEWIDDVAVPAFCRNQRASDRFRHSKTGEEE